MSDLRVIFATTDGQTRRIAEASAADARTLGIGSIPPTGTVRHTGVAVRLGRTSFR
jgi:hypothetical protein